MSSLNMVFAFPLLQMLFWLVTSRAIITTLWKVEFGLKDTFIFRGRRLFEKRKAPLQFQYPEHVRFDLFTIFEPSSPVMVGLKRHSRGLIATLLGLYVTYYIASKSGTPNMKSMIMTLAAAPYAKHISPQELMSRPLSPNLEAIPKLIHQSWSSNKLPRKFEDWSHSCRRQHSDWEWVLWTDEDNLLLVKTYFPWLLSAYENFPGVVYQADLVRNMYMYIYGG
jgi:hypothetical protein